MVSTRSVASLCPSQMARAHAENFLLLPPCGEMGPACSLSLAYPPAPTFSLIKHMQLHLWHPRFPFALALVSLAPFAPAATQLPQGVTREQMWYAPSAEDWQKPVQITFQRSWDDALALSKEQQRPILVCVNMDGEIASEHYAGVRYRLPEIETVMRDAGLEIARGCYYFGFVFPLAAAVRLADRNTTEPRSSLKKQGALTNRVLTALCAAELPLFPSNRLAGLSCFVLARKP